MIAFPGTSRLPELIERRRKIHSFPELRYEEFETARFIQNHLQSLGLRFEGGIAGTGIVCLFDSGKPGKTILLRADMDALPIHEENEVPYKSCIPGKMHACGHDGHTSILMTLASDLVEHPEWIPQGRVLLCFQPAEEGGSGAKKMIEAGILERYQVQEVYALHLWNHIQLGQVGVVPGTMMASVDEFRIEILGRSGHGAMPQFTIDPILVGAHLVTALQSFVSRNMDPLDAAVVTVGAFHSGEAFNVIPERASLLGTARAYSKEAYEKLPLRLEIIAEGVAKAFGAKIEMHYKRIDAPTTNHPKKAELVARVAEEILGSDSVTETNARTMGGEDFSAFLEKRPGCYFFVGSRNEEAGFVQSHHNSKFDFDEKAMQIGLEIFRGIIQKALVS